MTTISTVGYENIFTTIEGKIALIGMIVISIVTIPLKSSKLIELLSSKSMYARRKYKGS